MDTPKRDKEKGLTIGLVAIIIVIVILALIGFFLLEPRTETIQGQAEATQIRISGKLPGRIAEYWVEEGQHVHQGDTLVRISSPDAEAKLMQASAMESVYKATNEKVDKGARSEIIQAAYDMWITFNVREELLQDFTMGKEIQAVIPALGNKEVTLKIYFIKDMGTYAVWRATKATGGYDARTFQIKARPTAKIENLRPGMSVLVKKSHD